jgi:hypothetical protein
MAVNPKGLETPERGMELETREDQAGSRRGPAAELKALRDRIDTMRAQQAPEAPRVDAYSKDWWRRGWEAGWKAALEELSKG